MKGKDRVCDICGRKADEKHQIRYIAELDAYLCSKHKTQFYRYGKIIDETQRTTKDKNEYIIKDNYAEMIIRDKKQQIKAIVLIDVEDVEKCKDIKWTAHDKGYVDGNMKKYRLHRYLLNYDGPLQVDHINRNKLDNRKENLRIVNQFVNAQNNGAVGVSFDNKAKKWKAELQRYGKYFFLGLYETKEEAIQARMEAIEKAEQEKNKLLLEYKAKDPNHVTGVKPSSHGRWVAKFCADNKTYHVGTFNTKEEAVAARTAAILKHKSKASA